MKVLENIGHTSEPEEFVSLPRSKSLSNNGSRSSFLQNFNHIHDHEYNNEVINSNPQAQFFPLVLLCCPSIIKGEYCACNYNSYYPANDFFKSQLENKGMMPFFNNVSHFNSSGSGADNSGGSRFGGDSGNS